MNIGLVGVSCVGKTTILPPYTFFLLNGDMELHRNRYIFVEKMFKKPQSQLEETYIPALPTMKNLSPSLLCT